MSQNIQVKTILSKLRVCDTFFGITYNMNLYRGCQHGCIYCDTRSDCYGIGDISEICIKENALDLLSVELRVKREKGTIGTGSMNDPYMPLERDTELVRRALALIAKYNFPVHVLTKSSLVERDIDLLKDISRTYAAVSFSITTADDCLCCKLEPGAPVSSRRFKAMEKIAVAGIYTGMTLMPLLPYINDTPENLCSLLRMAKDSGAAYVLPMFGVTMRNGSRDYFYKSLEKTFPGLKEKYESDFGKRYICDSPKQRLLSDVFQNEVIRLGLSSEMIFYHSSPDPQLSLF